MEKWLGRKTLTPDCRIAMRKSQLAQQGDSGTKVAHEGLASGQKCQAPYVNLLSYWLAAFQEQSALTKMLLQIQRLCSLWLSANFCP